MARRDRQPDLPEPLEPPQRLVGDLRRLYSPAGHVPREVDEAVRDAAWRECGAVRVRRRIRWWSQVGVAAAAAFVLFWFRESWRPHPAPLPAKGPAIVADVDANGRVDILDAFALARRIESGAIPAGVGDLNHDGRVDRADVDAVAMQAVRLTEGASS